MGASMCSCSQPAGAEIHVEGPKEEVAAACPKILIVGAGFGGLGCAKNLVTSGVARAASVTVIDPRDYWSLGSLWSFVWTNRATLEDTKWSLAEASEMESLKGVDVRPKTSLCSLDLGGRKAVLSDGQPFCYDFLVLSPGMVSDPSSIRGLEEHVDVFDMGHIERAKAELAAFIVKAKEAKEKDEEVVFLVTIASMPYKCPPLPFEIAMLVDHQLRQAGAREGARIVITCPVPFPFGGPPPNAVSQAFLPLLQQKGIEWKPKHQLKSIGKSEARWSACFQADAGETSLEVDQVFAIYPQRAPDLFVSAGLTNPKGFIPVDLQTNELLGGGEEQKNVFVIGDAAWAVMPKPGQPHPHAGCTAWQMGGDVARRIAATLSGMPAPATTFRGGRCAMAAGGESGVMVEASLTSIIQNPQEGVPQIKASYGPTHGSEKIGWANHFITQVYGGDARLFQPLPAQ